MSPAQASAGNCGPRIVSTEPCLPPWTQPIICDLMPSPRSGLQAQRKKHTRPTPDGVVRRARPGPFSAARFGGRAETLATAAITRIASAAGARSTNTSHIVLKVRSICRRRRSRGHSAPKSTVAPLSAIGRNATRIHSALRRPPNRCSARLLARGDTFSAQQHRSQRPGQGKAQRSSPGMIASSPKLHSAASNNLKIGFTRFIRQFPFRSIQGHHPAPHAWVAPGHCTTPGGRSLTSPSRLALSSPLTGSGIDDSPKGAMILAKRPPRATKMSKSAFAAKDRATAASAPRADIPSFQAPSGLPRLDDQNAVNLGS